MNEKNIIDYYNKFNENKRLTRRHGIVEYTTSMKYILKYLKKIKNPKIIDIGAGTGKYSIELANMGYDVTAIELVKHNLMTLKDNSSKVKAYLGNALDLSKFKDNTFDSTLLFGPMYHLISNENKIKALKEARALGDLSENSDYDAARNDQAQLEGRIKELEYKLEHCNIAENHEDGVVAIGSVVTIEYDDGEVDEYKIVGSLEADPFENKISNESPIGKAVIGHKQNETVQVESPNGAYPVVIKEVK